MRKLWSSSDVVNAQFLSSRRLRYADRVFMIRGQAMADDPIAAARKSSESWYWWGIPTFFRCPWNEDPAAADIALVGVPHSTGNGSTERDQHLGPRAVRHQSGYYRRAHAIHNISPWEIARVHDLGD